jgi:UDP:flavonoid glycosyltransferase YjiC (YdhE family)
VTAVVATAGRLQVKDKPSNVYVADYLPGETIAARSALVICNGGSPTTYQAFAAGAPVLGIASNMDQYLNMQCIERFGAGRVLRADQARAASIRAAIREILDSAFHRGKVDELVQRIHSTHSADRFAALIHDITKSAPLSRPLQARC